MSLVRKVFMFLGKPIVAWIFVGVVVTASAVGYWLLTQPVSNIPANIRSSLTFTPISPDGSNSDYSVSDYKFSTAEDDVQILSYIITTPNSSISVSQYVQPPAFTDIPEYKDRFLDNIIKRYSTVQTANGAIYLGRATKQDNKQLGVMLERGLIVFFSPKSELSEAEWRNLGDQMVLSR